MRALFLSFAFVLAAFEPLSAGDNHSLAYLDECNPWYPNKDFPKLITPQWVGEEGVDCVVVLAIDDMRDTAKYEQYLRPILNRLKQIDGRAPVSIMTCDVKPDDPQLQSWLEEGLSIEVHTIDHPCPLLQGGDFDKAQSTYDRCIDLLNQIPGNKPVAFRTPCCDSLNTVSPQFYSTIFNDDTPGGHRLQLDSSVFNFFTSADKSIPRDLILDADGRERFQKYRPTANNRGGLSNDNFVNLIDNYPYPYLIANTQNSCWQFPCVAPSDWSAQHLHGSNNPATVNDWKVALDITVHKQGVFNLVFHPHGWMSAEQIVELIDHAVSKHGKRVKFLTFREAADRLSETLKLPDGEHSIRLDHKEEFRLVDLQNDGLLDIVTSSETRVWSSDENRWGTPAETPFPIREFGRGHSWYLAQGVFARLTSDRVHVIHSGVGPSAWYFDADGNQWAADASVGDVLAPPQANSEVVQLEQVIGLFGMGIVVQDIDSNGTDELITADDGIFGMQDGKFQKLPYSLPESVVQLLAKHNEHWGDRIPDHFRRPAIRNLQFVDIDEDNWLDLAYSNFGRSVVVLFNPKTQAWDRVVMDAGNAEWKAFFADAIDASQGKEGEFIESIFADISRELYRRPHSGVLPPTGEVIGGFIHDGHFCWQNIHTDRNNDLLHRVSFKELLAPYQRQQAESEDRNKDTDQREDGAEKCSTPNDDDERPDTTSDRSEQSALIGAAVLDITPEYPVRLTGYGNRTGESEGVAAKIHARALAIGGSEPSIVSNATLRHQQSPILTSLKRNASEVGPACRAGLPPQADRGGQGVSGSNELAIPGGSESGSRQVAKSSPAGWTYQAGSDQSLTILITVDNCGVPAGVAEAVFEKLHAKHGITRERFAVCSTHTHSGPWLRGFAPNVLVDLPEEHAAHLKQYEADLISHLVEVAKKAIETRRPGQLSVGRGKVGFAMNRRSLADGRWTGFGEVPDGPVDHQFPLLVAHDTDGKLIAVLANYACHATTETGAFNQISGDWPGFAADMIEADNPGAVALIAIGCGADANPSPRGTHEQAQQHGRTVADEVNRLLGNVAVTLRVTRPAQLTSPPAAAPADAKTASVKVEGDGSVDNSTTSDTARPHHAERDGYLGLQPVDPQIVCNMSRVDLPLGPLPSREVWEAQAQQANHAGALAKRFLKMLDDGQKVPDSVPNYPVQTWCFGNDLAMVFLGGEVVVDYSIRLNEMFDDERLWINAYSNDVPCYIASKRILREGGYEADSSMIYYAHPTRLAPEAEDIICDAVQKLLPHEFYSDKLQADFPGPKSPEDSLAAITVRPGLTVELVAAEPLIHDPVAFDWDVQGRLWVVDMGDYPSGDGVGPSCREGLSAKPNHAADGAASDREQSEKKSDTAPQSRQAAKSRPAGGTYCGRVRVLEDTDGDGRYDVATTFLDGLAFPTGIHPWRNGMIITCAPDIIYAEDTDGDFVADKQTVLYTGFTEGNQQHRVNGLRWGLDGWLYLANGDSGGDISAVATANGEKLNVPGTIEIRGRDLRIQPDTGAIDTLSGQTQFGRERDDFGNWFGNNNSNPIWHYILEDRYLRRNPHATGLATRHEVAEVPGAAPVFPISKTLARFNDFHAANRFTSACSTSIYRDYVLGDEFYGNAFTCEPVHNLVSRLVLERDGVSFKGRRADDERESEFFASADNWTRPVMVRTGPDGALYIADMYRQVIEHPQWIPAEYQRKLDLYAGNTMGRIYRVLPRPGRAGGRGRGEVEKVSESDRRVREGAAERDVVSVVCCGTSDGDVEKTPGVENDSDVSKRSSKRPFSPEGGEGGRRPDEGATSSGQLRLTALHTGKRHIVSVADEADEQPQNLRAWFNTNRDEIPVTELVERLSSPNGWWRDTVQRLLVHRNDVSDARLADIMNLARDHKSPAVRLTALCTFAVLTEQRGLHEARRELLIHALSDEFAEVRRHAIRLCETDTVYSKQPPLGLTNTGNDVSPIVRQQWACSLGELSDDATATSLGHLFLNGDNDAFVIEAALTSLKAAHTPEVLRTIADPARLKATDAFPIIVRTAIAGGQAEAIVEPLGRMIDSVASDKEAQSADRWKRATTVLRQLKGHDSVLQQLRDSEETRLTWQSAVDQASVIPLQSELDLTVRISALEFIGAAGSMTDRMSQTLPTLLSPASPIELQAAVIRTFASANAAQFTQLVFSRWRQLSPATRSVALTEIGTQETWTKELLHAIASKQLTAADIDATARERLLNHRNKELRSSAEKLLGAPTSSERSAVVRSLQAQISRLNSDAAAGKSVFEKRCAACHKLQDVGKQIGADLAALKDRSQDALLTAILDPNKAVETKFLSYTAVTGDGRIFSGMLLNETGNSLTLLGVDGKEISLARSDLEEIACSNRSLMPEGLEKDLSPQDLADVIAFVQSSGTSWKRFDGNIPRIITASADGTLTLPATAAEIYGPSLVFEGKYENLGWWSSADDYAVWTIEVPRSGFWTVEFDYACDNGAAGNAIKLSTGNRLFSARVPGTGSWDDYRTWTAGKIDLGGGRRTLIVTAPEMPSSALIDLRSIRLIPPE